MHVVGDVAPRAALEVPLKHLAHALADVAPGEMRYVPLPQRVLLAVPGVPVHVPGRHSLHDVAPAPLKLPGGQDTHVAGEFAAIAVE